MQAKAEIFKKLLKENNTLVLDVSPLFSKRAIKKVVDGKNTLPIYLYDQPENIFSKLAFTDDNDQINEL